MVYTLFRMRKSLDMRKRNECLQNTQIREKDKSLRSLSNGLQQVHSTGMRLCQTLLGLGMMVPAGSTGMLFASMHPIMDCKTHRCQRSQADPCGQEAAKDPCSLQATNGKERHAISRKRRSPN